MQNLEEEVTYTFTVRAQTIDYGPPIIGNVTTGPQEGSPTKLRDLLITKTVSSVELHWKNGPSGKGKFSEFLSIFIIRIKLIELSYYILGPILGYYIESKKRGKFFSINVQTNIDNTLGKPKKKIALKKISLNFPFFYPCKQ